MTSPEAARKWSAVILAAGRGPDDPLAAAFDVSHKCLIPVGGTAMLKRVVDTLAGHRRIAEIVVSIEDARIVDAALGGVDGNIRTAKSASSAAASLEAILASGELAYPILVTTADHALLDGAMLDHFIDCSDEADADLTAGFADDRTILAAYPDAKRTFWKFGSDRVSGCNLYGLKTPAAAAVVKFWRRVEKDRKRPWRLIGAFGFAPLWHYLTGSLSLKKAFSMAGAKLGISAAPVLMPFADAAVDVDKPEDKHLVEEILSRRES